jgi:hypothetical protein
VRSFACHNCGQLVFFDNDACLNCGFQLGFAWRTRELLTLRGNQDGLVPLNDDVPLHRCANAQQIGCNWLVTNPGDLCFACSLTSVRPADDDLSGLGGWRLAEEAKRRLVFELAELGLPVEPRHDGGGLAFEMLSSEWEPVTTGHADGVITLDLAESDDAHRVAMREQMGEPYRTLLGHLRHEVGHYYFPILVHDDATFQRARALFGDERADYQAALDRHYEQGPPANWREQFVSAYATMHPSEDWAETFSHYLHITDTLQTAAAHNVTVGSPDAPVATELSARPDDQAPADFNAILAEWLPLTYALNAINRSMGRPDLYPFVLPPPAVQKLAFVHELVRGQQ